MRAVLGVAWMSLAAVASAQVTVQPLNYHGWSGSYRLHNGTAEIVVVPAVGRIMRYGFIGGRNLIWEDPALHGKPPDRTAFPRFGGNKAWPCPQNEWPRHIGHEWPPPPAADQAPFTAVVVGRDTIRMTSPLVAGFGVRIVREIRLAPTGSQITLTTRLEHVSVAGPAQSLAAWSITPAAAPDMLLVHLTPDSTLAAHYKTLGAFDPFAEVTAQNGLLTIVAQPNKSSKIGIDGDAIGAVCGDTLWLLRDRSPKTTGSYAPGEHVQIFANAVSPEDTARGLPPYREWEMTSARTPLSRSGDSAVLTEVWELRKLPPGDPGQRRALIEASLSLP